MWNFTDQSKKKEFRLWTRWTCWHSSFRQETSRSLVKTVCTFSIHRFSFPFFFGRMFWKVQFLPNPYFLSNYFEIHIFYWIWRMIELFSGISPKWQNFSYHSLRPQSNGALLLNFYNPFFVNFIEIFKL